MKYFIKQKKLPFSEEHHDFTLTICLGMVQGDAESYEAKIQFPAESYRDGLSLYRRFVQEQKEFFGKSQEFGQAISEKNDPSDDQQAIAFH